MRKKSKKIPIAENIPFSTNERAKPQEGENEYSTCNLLWSIKNS